MVVAVEVVVLVEIGSIRNSRSSSGSIGNSSSSGSSSRNSSSNNSRSGCYCSIR